MKKFLSSVCLSLLVAACGGLGGMNGDFTENTGGAGLQEASLNSAADGIPADAENTSQDLIYAGQKYYIGTPYKIEDVQYAPAENYNYNEIGTVGIVPLDLNGVATTNGEKFDTNAMFATSKVLPLPSIVKITNMETDAAAVVRVNNMGPFVNNRLMDVSPAVARKLGMTGETKVRVQILADESKKVKELTLEMSGAGANAAETSGATTGPYAIQVGAYYSEESANSIAGRISHLGNAKIVQESGMYKIRITGLTAEEARKLIDRLRNEENMAPGLLKNGRWVNVDSI
jgi:rare lipoprotein A (peptidoglycan hydrolase)